jgi:hypothetical protein
MDGWGINGFNQKHVTGDSQTGPNHNDTKKKSTAPRGAANQTSSKGPAPDGDGWHTQHATDMAVGIYAIYAPLCFGPAVFGYCIAGDALLVKAICHVPSIYLWFSCLRLAVSHPHN